MFARVFDTARRILRRSPSVSRASTEAREVPPTSAPSTAAATMVTTRGGVETPGAATPRSSVRKQAGKRGPEALDTPTRAKRQRKSALVSKKKDVEQVAAESPVQESTEDTSDTVAVAVAGRSPVSGKKETSKGSAKKGSLAIRRRSSPQVVVAKLSPPASTAPEDLESAIQDNEPTKIQKTPGRTPNLQSSAVEASPTAKVNIPKTATPVSGKKQRGRPRKVQHEDDAHTVELTQTTTRVIDEIPSSSYESNQAPILSQEAAKSSPQPKKAHKRFGSEEPTEPIATKNQVSEPIEDEDDSASDSDEAPEVVTAATATSKAQAAQAEATRALLAQQQKENTKRAAREQLIAAQQAAKREREEKKAIKLARKQAKQAAKSASGDEEVPATRGLDAIEGGLPALLPDSLLSVLPDQRAPTPPPTRRGKTEAELRREKLNHHIKFLERSEKPIKDLKKGKLSVAVLGQHNKVMPPKTNKSSSNVREHWLKGRSVQKKKKGGKQKSASGRMERRRAGGGGFLRGED